MPIYEYYCRICDHRFEKLLLKGHDPEDTVCPACGRKDLDIKALLISTKGRNGRSHPGSVGRSKDGSRD
jgi:putative FmdB family regulatory protein